MPDDKNTNHNNTQNDATGAGTQGDDQPLDIATDDALNIITDAVDAVEETTSVLLNWLKSNW